jgi:hypothetical protein
MLLLILFYAVEIRKRKKGKKGALLFFGSSNVTTIRNIEYIIYHNHMFNAFYCLYLYVVSFYAHTSANISLSLSLSMVLGKRLCFCQ